MGAVTLLSAGTTVAAGTAFRPSDNGNRTYQATLTGTSGALAATVLIEGSNDGGSHWETLQTFTLTVGAWTTVADDDHGGAASLASWHLVRANVTAISGTGASVTVKMGWGEK